MKKYFFLAFLFVFLGIVYFLSNQSSNKSALPNSTPTPSQVVGLVDYKAGFAIFTNGTFRIFTAPMYHNLSEDIFIQADNPNIVRVRKKGTTWNDFFKTLPMQLSKTCLVTGTKQTFCTNENSTLRFYINGKRDGDALDKEIQHGDRLLVSYGNEKEEEILQQMQSIPNNF